MVIKIELKCLLIIFIYFNLKFKVTCKNEDLEYPCIKTHFEKKSKIGTTTVASFFFGIKINQLNCHPG